MNYNPRKIFFKKLALGASLAVFLGSSFVIPFFTAKKTRDDVSKAVTCVERVYLTKNPLEYQDSYLVHFIRDGQLVRKRCFVEGAGESDNKYRNGPYPTEIEEKNRFKGLKKYGKHVKVFNDLEESMQSYADVLHFEFPDELNKKVYDYYAEIHLPKNQRLNLENKIYKIGKEFKIFQGNQNYLSGRINAKSR